MSKTDVEIKIKPKRKSASLTEGSLPNKSYMCFDEWAERAAILLKAKTSAAKSSFSSKPKTKSKSEKKKKLSTHAARKIAPGKPPNKKRSRKKSGQPNMVRYNSSKGRFNNIQNAELSVYQQGEGGAKKQTAHKWTPKPVAEETREVLCPVCLGDGGARNCYKCDGIGWVSRATKADHSANEHTVSDNDESRISNANYPDHHVGAHYRDRDGRFGSIPSYDDYSEEGEA